MSDYPRSPTAAGAGRQYESLLAAAEAERDRYQLLLDVNNAVVTHLDLGSLLRAISDALRKVVPHDAASIYLYDRESGQVRLHGFDLQYASDLEEGALCSMEGSPEGLAFTSRRPVVIKSP